MSENCGGNCAACSENCGERTKESLLAALNEQSKVKKVIAKDESDWVRVENAHEDIVDYDS